MKLIALLVLLVTSLHVSAAETRPNIVLIFADDLGYGEVNSDIVDGKFIPGALAEQLYDLGSDPGQKKNAIGQHAEYPGGLTMRLAALVAEAPAPPAAKRKRP